MIIGDGLRERAMVLYIYGSMNWWSKYRAGIGYHVNTPGFWGLREGTYNHYLSLTYSADNMRYYTNMGEYNRQTCSVSPFYYCWNFFAYSVSQIVSLISSEIYSKTYVQWSKEQFPVY